MSQCPFCLSTKIIVGDYYYDMSSNPDFFPCGGNHFYASCQNCFARGPIVRKKEHTETDQEIKLRALKKFFTIHNKESI